MNLKLKFDTFSSQQRCSQICREVKSLRCNKINTWIFFDLFGKLSTVWRKRHYFCAYFVFIVEFDQVNLWKICSFSIWPLDGGRSQSVFVQLQGHFLQMSHFCEAIVSCKFTVSSYQCEKKSI